MNEKRAYFSLVLALTCIGLIGFFVTRILPRIHDAAANTTQQSMLSLPQGPHIVTATPADTPISTMQHTEETAPVILPTAPKQTPTTPINTATPMPTNTPTPTITPTIQPTNTPTATPNPTITPLPSPTPTDILTPTPPTPSI